MSKQAARYQRLAPLSIEQRISVALAAMRFFSPLANAASSAAVGVTQEKGKLRALGGWDFLKFLALPTSLLQAAVPDPERRMQRIEELLLQLERAGLLNESFKGAAPPMNRHYFTMYEQSKIEQGGWLYLARALGAPFLHHTYKPGTYMITGHDEHQDEHAGTGIAISPRCLLTCAHVINDMTVHEKQDAQDGGEYNIVSKRTHDRIDVGLIEVDRDLHVVPGLNFRDPSVGERVYTYGYPPVPLAKTASLVMQGGEVSVENVTTYFGEEVFLFSAIARPGNSGGPILSGDGHVVGIVTKELTEQKGSAPAPATGSDGGKKQTVWEEFSNHPYHAGIAASTIAQALEDMDSPVQLPVETWA